MSKELRREGKEGEKELNTARERRKAAIALFREVKKELEKGMVVSRERLLETLDEGNRRLLPPDGITAETDLEPVRKWWQKLVDAVLPEDEWDTNSDCAALSTKYSCRVSRVLDANHYGVILTEGHWEGGRSNKYIKNWVYPDKGEVQEGEW